MPYVASQGFTTRHDGRRVRFGRGDKVPDSLARRVPNAVRQVGPVEQATAAPGEVRETTHVCDECGYVARTRAGLGAHSRTHKDDG